MSYNDGLHGLTDEKKAFLASYDVDGRAIQFAVGYDFYTNMNKKQSNLIRVQMNDVKSGDPIYQGMSGNLSKERSDNIYGVAMSNTDSDGYILLSIYPTYHISKPVKVTTVNNNKVYISESEGDKCIRPITDDISVNIENVKNITEILTREK